MTGRIMDIKRFAVHDGDGIRTTVFFKGCPLRCAWCHNPEGLSALPQLAYTETRCLSCGLCVSACPRKAHTLENGVHAFDRARCVACGKCEDVCPGGALKLYGRTVNEDELLALLTEDKDFYDTSGGGVTFSGGECLLQAPFCARLAKRLNENGIKVDIDTCGDVPFDAFEQLLPYTDTFLYDVKAFSPELHEKLTGRRNERILENLTALCARGARVEIRIPFVPGENDGETEAIAAFLAPLKLVGVRVLPYHNLAGSKYASLGLVHALSPRVPTIEETAAAEAILVSRGVRVLK